MKIVLAGGTGQVGRLLARAFTASGDDVVILTRDPTKPVPHGRPVDWNGENLGPWATEIDGADVVVGLAGRSVNCRYNATNRSAIKASRQRSVRAIGAAIQSASRPPSVWLQASTATIYRHTYGPANDELTGVIGGNETDAPDTWNFSIDVATSWERELDSLGDLPGTRTVLLRSAMTMSPDRAGVFDTLRRLVRLGLGGTIGDGRQYVSWIHEADFVASLRWIIAHQQLSGAVNIASPHPVPNREFMQSLRAAEGIPFGLPAFGIILETGAWLMQTESELILKSRRVVPTRLVESGFRFQFPNWPEAANDLCERSREKNQ